MNKLVFILIIFGLISCKPKKDDADKELVAGTTEVQMDEFMHDFGTISAGEIVVFNFTVNNIGSKNLIINSAETDCGCVTIHLPDDAIKPGENGNIEVEFDSSGLYGKQLKTIDLDWNCKEQKQLVIFATVKNEEIEIIY